MEYDATICDRCCCSKCKYNAETQISNVSLEESRGIEAPCFNCGECYYYGMDDENLSRHLIKFECDKFEMSNYYADIEAKRKRKGFKII